MDIYQILATHNRPWSVRETICFSIILTIVGWFLWRSFRTGRIRLLQALASFLTVIFLGIVFGSTIFTRGTTIRQYKLIPFWSWKEVLLFHDRGLLREKIC